MRAACAAVATVYLLSVGGVALAGGPKLFTQATPLLWDGGRLDYKIDQGDLGAIPEREIQSWIKDAFRTWAQVPTASVTPSFRGLWDHDIRDPGEFLILYADLEAGQGDSVVVLDDTGDMVDQVLGGTGHKEFILGATWPFVVGNRIVRFTSLFNGYLVDLGSIKGILIHEAGHALGLDHAQIQWSLANDGIKQNDVAVPRMFPKSTDSELFRSPLHADDIAWLSRLYPRAGHLMGHSVLKGSVRRRDGGILRGANVIAVSQDDGKREVDRYSCVSDYLMGGNGAFEIPVPPGKYTLMIEQIRPEFYDERSVGPYAATSTDISFVNPVVFYSDARVFAVQSGVLCEVGILTLP